MNKFKSHWWALLSVVLIVLSSFPLQTIAENLQTSEKCHVRNLQLTDLEGEAFPQKIDPEETLMAQFDLEIDENEKSTLDLPAEIMVNDQKLYQQEEITVSIEENQLVIDNNGDQKTSIEDVSFGFQLTNQVRSSSQAMLRFFNEFEFELNLKQEQSTKKQRIRTVQPKRRRGKAVRK